ncbi:hypothetical protein [Sphaerisporangium sp. TRM90804]|uniref:hypothetical protein n=1 Tax=Sphaerisporangium sp. TRM90804 TaxID=3031113 RepID=UPI002449B462|nr:hypothetical protein [Sphaerisporangium sp. TRM90804]MDH2426854.1 hypothetical protein [Sphaerisporangium sp. TRM90804]
MDEPRPVATIVEVEHGLWQASLPGVGTVTVDDPRMAAWQLQELVAEQRVLNVLDVHPPLLADAEGRPVFAFLLLLDPAGAPGEETGAWATVQADPPPGCRWLPDAARPGLVCLRPGASPLDAMAGVVAEVRERYGLGAELNDLGFDRLWDWFGDHERRTELVAHLLLMAAHRADLLGLAADDLAAFLRRVMSPRA